MTENDESFDKELADITERLVALGSPDRMKMALSLAKIALKEKEAKDKALRMKWEAQDAAADVTAAIFFRPAACSGRRVFPRTAHEVEGVPHVVECTRATSSIRRPPAAAFTRSARTVCVSLFYVIDTGSTSTRARHHVTGWGVPIYTHHP